MRNRFHLGMLKLRGLAAGVAGALRRPAHAGQTMVLFALMAVVLVGFLGLAIDAGYLITERRGVQNAADAAALVAARLRSRGATKEAATAAALAYVAGNEYDGATVDIEYDDDRYRVTVKVRQEVPPFFIGVFYTGDWATKAVAVAEWEPKASPYALIALGKKPAPGITFSGLNAPQGSITVSCDPPEDDCGSIGSNSDITFNGNPSGEIGGNIHALDELDSVPSSFHFGGDAAGGQEEIDDPFENTPTPSCSTDGTITVDSQGRWHLSPGRYTKFQAPAPTATPDPGGGSGGGKGGGKGGGNSGGGSNSGGGGAANPTGIVFEGPGIFCFDGQGASLDIEPNTPHESTGGVLLYFTNGATISLQAGSQTDLRVISAAADGTATLGNPDWDQIAIWVDTPVSQCKGDGDKNAVRLEGRGELDIQGAIYAPNSQITLGGDSGSKTIGGPVIGYCVDIKGSVIFNITVPESLEIPQGQVYLIE